MYMMCRMVLVSYRTGHLQTRRHDADWSDRDTRLGTRARLTRGWKSIRRFDTMQLSQTLLQRKLLTGKRCVHRLKVKSETSQLHSTNDQLSGKEWSQ